MARSWYERPLSEQMMLLHTLAAQRWQEGGTLTFKGRDLFEFTTILAAWQAKALALEHPGNVVPLLPAAAPKTKETA